MRRAFTLIPVKGKGLSPAGFTLIEILVVIVIVAVVASIVIGLISGGCNKKPDSQGKPVGSSDMDRLNNRT